MRTLLVWALLPSLALAQAAGDGDDAPLPYSDDVPEPPRDEKGLRELPRRSDPTVGWGDEEAEAVPKERVQRLARLDDPNLGLGGELLAGALAIHSSRGAGTFAETRLAVGVRFHWEVGRVFAASPWDEALFADVTWAFSRLQQGTEQVHATGSYHYFSAAPALQYPLPVLRQLDLLAFGQLGAGMAFQHSTLTVGGEETTIAGLKPLFQYGLGLRARPRLSPAGPRLLLRLEATRLRRGYLNDTLLAFSAGAAF